jgi:hypothetical protein
LCEIYQHLLLHTMQLTAQLTLHKCHTILIKHKLTHIDSIKRYQMALVMNLKLNKH